MKRNELKHEWIKKNIKVNRWIWYWMFVRNKTTIWCWGLEIGIVIEPVNISLLLHNTLPNQHTHLKTIPIDNSQSTPIRIALWSMHAWQFELCVVIHFEISTAAVYFKRKIFTTVTDNSPHSKQKKDKTKQNKIQDLRWLKCHIRQPFENSLCW